MSTFSSKMGVQKVAEVPKKKVYTQGGKPIQEVTRELRNGETRSSYIKPTYGLMTDAELTDWSAGMGKFMGRGAANEQQRRVGVANEQAAANQAAETTRARNEQQQAMLNLQRESQNLAANGGADLGADATAANVVAGGTADSEGSNDAVTKKKKATGTGMAMQLGINV